MLMSLKKGIYSYNEEIIVSNIKKHLDNLKEFTSTKGYGVTRLPFTKEAKQAVSYLENEMKKIGLKTRVDESGAIIGRLEGKKEKTIIIGSHYDSVSYGGSFDGIAGIVCGMEVAKLIIENNI
ncbi:M20 family metallo-hydrolase, partial [Clostridium butyricum]